jgi:hypothetical protein
MMNRFSNVLLCSLVAVLSLSARAQKVEVGYDKGADFPKFKTYTWAAPSMPSTRPLLYTRVVDAVDFQLEQRGFSHVDNNGDLLLVPAGGMEFGLNVAAAVPIIPSYSGVPPMVNATMWTGAIGGSNLMAPYVPEGTLALTFVDQANNKVIWSGTVKEKLDMTQKDKSLQRVDKAIAKLLKRFPPQQK